MQIADNHASIILVRRCMMGILSIYLCASPMPWRSECMRNLATLSTGEKTKHVDECGTSLNVPMHGSLLPFEVILPAESYGLMESPLYCIREVLNYYSGDENAYDMRKAMPRDVRKTSVIPLKRPVRPEELEFD